MNVFWLFILLICMVVNTANMLRTDRLWLRFVAGFLALVCAFMSGVYLARIVTGIS